MSKAKDLQKVISLYRVKTGKKEIDMHNVAKWAVDNGYPPPAPTDPIDRLAKEFARAAREEMRHDASTGRPYRANHAVTTTQGERQLTFWVDIDEAPRKHMQKSLTQRREQIVGDNLQLSLDADHWNTRNATEEPIVIALDYTDDVEWRKNAPDDESEAS